MQFSVILLLGLRLPLALSHPEVSSSSANEAKATVERRHHKNTPVITADTEQITARAAEPVYNFGGFAGAEHEQQQAAESRSSASVAAEDSADSAYLSQMNADASYNAALSEGLRTVRFTSSPRPPSTLSTDQSVEPSNATVPQLEHEVTDITKTGPVTARAAQPAHGPIDAFNDAMNDHEDKQESKSSVSVASKESVSHSKADAEAGITDTGVYEREVDPPNAQITATPTQDGQESPPNGNFNDAEVRDDGDHAVDQGADLNSEFTAGFATTSTSHAHGHRHAHKTTNTGPITARAALIGVGYLPNKNQASREKSLQSVADASRKSVSSVASVSEASAKTASSASAASVSSVQASEASVASSLASSAYAASMQSVDDGLADFWAHHPG